MPGNRRHTFSVILNTTMLVLRELWLSTEDMIEVWDELSGDLSLIGVLMVLLYGSKLLCQDQTGADSSISRPHISHQSREYGDLHIDPFICTVFEDVRESWTAVRDDLTNRNLISAANQWTEIYVPNHEILSDRLPVVESTIDQATSDASIQPIRSLRGVWSMYTSGTAYKRRDKAVVEVKAPSSEDYADCPTTDTPRKLRLTLATFVMEIAPFLSESIRYMRSIKAELRKYKKHMETGARCNETCWER